MRTLLSCLFLLSFSQLLPAQTPRSTPSPDGTSSTEEVVEEPEFPLIGFAIYVWPTGGILTENDSLSVVPTSVYNSPDGPRLIRMSQGRTTQLFPYQDEQPLVLYKYEVKEVAPPPEATPGTPPTLERSPTTPVIRATIPEDLTRALLVVFPNKRNRDGTFQTLVVPYDQEVLRPGMGRVINGTGREMILSFKDSDVDPMPMKPGKPVDFVPPRIPGDRGFAWVNVHEMYKGRLVKTHASRLLFETNKANVFIASPRGSRRIEFVRIGAHKEQEWLKPTPTPVPESEEGEEGASEEREVSRSSF